ncbi:MAG: DUF4097 family beta strand repeat-containing protein [Elusimicrobiaceae bacterium]|nr:DUF4097 family beta strand repeat-containing protein [Elusimicrobiaceae bacterium]
MNCKHAVLFFACCALAPAMAAETTVTRQYKPGEIKTLNIATVSGGIDLDVETGPARLEVSRYDDKLCTLSITLERGELAARIAPVPDSGGACRAQVHITVPDPAVEPALKTVSGFIDVSGIGSRADLASTSGDITVRAGSDIAVRTVSGDIMVTGAAGNIDAGSVSGAIKIYSGSAVVARNISGDIHVAYTKGRADLGTKSGGITGLLSGPARIETVSGPVDLDWAATPPAGEITAASVSGHIGLDFPVGAKLAFYRETVTGTVTGQKTMLDMSSRLKVTVTTTSGDIDLGYN